MTKNTNKTNKTNKTNMTNMTKKLTLTLLSLAALAFVATPALAQPAPDGQRGFRRGKGFGMPGPDGQRGFRRGKRLELLKAELGLSDAQVQQIKAIKAATRQRTKGYRGQLRPLRQQMRLLMGAETIDEAQVAAVHNQIKTLQQLMAQERFRSRLQVMKVLTKDQRVKLMQKRKGRKGHKGHKMRGQGRGGRWG